MALGLESEGLATSGVDMEMEPLELSRTAGGSVKWHSRPGEQLQVKHLLTIPSSDPASGGWGYPREMEIDGHTTTYTQMFPEPLSY